MLSVHQVLTQDIWSERSCLFSLILKFMFLVNFLLLDVNYYLELVPFYLSLEIFYLILAIQ